MNRTLIAATLVVAGAWAREAAAEETDPNDSPPACARPLDADAVVRCALAASPEVRRSARPAGRGGGRRATAGVWLPSNPTVERPRLATAGGLRRTGVRPELERRCSPRSWRSPASAARAWTPSDGRGRGARPPGRRRGAGGRRGGADRLLRGDRGTGERFASRRSWRRRPRCSGGVRGGPRQGGDARRGRGGRRAGRGDAHRSGPVRGRAPAGGRHARRSRSCWTWTRARWRCRARSWCPAGRNCPPAARCEDQALRLRGEVAAAEMERQVLERRLALVRRERVPNPTLSAFGERGEINDRILGVGLSIPIPLPAPVGRTRAGEIAETMAQIRAAESSERAGQAARSAGGGPGRGDVQGAPAGGRPVRRRSSGAGAHESVVAARGDLVAPAIAAGGAAVAADIDRAAPGGHRGAPGRARSRGWICGGSWGCRSRPAREVRDEVDRARVCLIALALTSTGCSKERSESPPASGQSTAAPPAPSKPADAAVASTAAPPHEDESEHHEELPTKVRLPPSVVRSAGIKMAAATRTACPPPSISPARSPPIPTSPRGWPRASPGASST